MMSYPARVSDPSAFICALGMMLLLARQYLSLDVLALVMDAADECGAERGAARGAAWHTTRG